VRQREGRILLRNNLIATGRAMLWEFYITMACFFDGGLKLRRAQIGFRI
jgi:hypothetical protein